MLLPLHSPLTGRWLPVCYGVQSFQATLDYVTEVFQCLPQRYRGGVDEGLEFARVAAEQDGVEWNEEEVYEALMTELQGLIDERLGSGEENGDKKPRARTIAWYIERHHEPVAPSVDTTVLQACYFAMALKHHHNMTDAGMDKLCAGLSVGGLWPEDNLMPRCGSTPMLHNFFTVGTRAAVATSHVH